MSTTCRGDLRSQPTAGMTSRSGTVPFAADPPLSGPPRHGLALIANPSERILIMNVDRGLLVILEARPGKEEELAAFLTQAQPLAAAEPGTVTWYAFKLSNTTYGIFDTFAGEDGRQAHLNGPIAAALGQAGPGLLAKDPDIQKTDILAA